MKEMIGTTSKTTTINNNNETNTRKETKSKMSTSSDDPPPGPEELRDDQLSRRYYIGGLIGLPWLWIVHAIHYYGKQRNEDAQRILREEQHIAGMYKRRTKRNETPVVLCCVVLFVCYLRHVC